MQGLVLGGSKNLFDVECDDGVTRLCSIKGKKLDVGGKYYNPLAPGDIVAVEPDEKTDEQGQILKLMPRRNEYGRWNVKGREPQLLAANVDLILCITTPAEPPFRPRFVDRVLAQAECAGIKPMIVCNKCDLEAAEDPDFEFRLTDWQNIGYDVIRVSAATGDGIDVLLDAVKGKLCVLTGQSGVGKSSIINRLDPSLNLRTGELSDKYGRGTHTTTKGSLLHINNGSASIIDTPGVRRFVLNDIAPCDLALYFREMRPLLGKCSYGMSCTHTHEAGCKILEGVYAGAISEERYESWQRICDELSTGSWED